MPFLQLLHLTSNCPLCRGKTPKCSTVLEKTSSGTAGVNFLHPSFVCFCSAETFSCRVLDKAIERSLLCMYLFVCLFDDSSTLLLMALQTDQNNDCIYWLVELFSILSFVTNIWKTFLFRWTFVALMLKDRFVSQDETEVRNSMQSDDILLFHLLLWQHALVPQVLRLA